MRDLTEELAARTSAVIRITDPLEGVAPADTASPKNYVDAATGVATSESGTLAEVSYPELDKAVKEWEALTGAAIKPIAEVVAEGLEAGRSMEDILVEVHARLNRHHVPHPDDAAAPVADTPAPPPQPALPPQHAIDIKH
jgi:hypothetical protein